MIDLIIAYPEITHVWIEKNTFSGADANRLENKMKENPILRNRRIEILNEHQNKNKDDKISTSIEAINNGQVIFAEEDKDFTQQILDFCGQDYSEHDDAPDITSEFINKIDNVEVRPSFSITTWDELYG